MKTITSNLYGYDRRAKVPTLENTTPRVCGRCDRWFASFPREKFCDACLRPSERARRAVSKTRASYTQTSRSLSDGPAQRRGKKAVPSGSDLCMELALELAEKLDYPKGRPQHMSRATKLAYIRRNVEAGLQGRCDLDRLARTTAA